MRSFFFYFFFEGVHLLCLKRGDRPLEDHTPGFIDLVHQTRYQDYSLCVFFYTSLSEQSKARIPGHSSEEDFATFLKREQMNNNSLFTISPMEDYTSPTRDPVFSHSLPMSCTEDLLEPTAGHEIEPAMMYEPEPVMRMEKDITPESLIHTRV